MLLTIGMIVKNEERYLERCLTAIKPILDSLDSELIITDTGSTDKTVEIAERFTDKVLHFDWVDDFSAARNFGLKQAKGEWFMMLDGDDIFRSCDGIIKFFKSGEYKKYNSAAYVGRNFTHATDRKFYVDNFQPRLTRLLPHTQYKGVVHENLNTYGQPIKIIGDIAEHYGYIYETKEDEERKYRRNYDLLMKKFDPEHNEDSLIYLQLHDTCSTFAPEEAERFLEQGIEWCKARNHNFLPLYYVTKARNAFNHLKYEEALAVCDDYFAMNKHIRPDVLSSDMEILAMQSQARYELHDFDNAETSFKRFFDVFRDVKSGKLNTPENSCLTVVVATDYNYTWFLRNFLACCLRNRHFNTAVEYASKLPIGKYSENTEMVEDVADQELRVFEKSDYSSMAECWKKFGDDGRERFIRLAIKTAYYSEKKDELVAGLKKLPVDNRSLHAKLSIIGRYFSGDDIADNELYNYAAEYGISDNPDILMIAMNKGYDISRYLALGSYDAVKCVSDGYKGYYGFHKAVEEYTCDKIASTDDLPALANFWEYCMTMTLNFKSPKPGVFIVLSPERIMNNYAALGKKYISEKGITELSGLPESVHSAAIMSNVIALRQEKRYKECIAEMKKAVAVNGRITSVISAYSDDVIKEYEKAQSTASAGMSELDRLAVTIKKNIRAFIAAGRTADAAKTLSEYENINPRDEEIPDLRAEITANS